MYVLGWVLLLLCDVEGADAGDEPNFLHPRWFWRWSADRLRCDTENHESPQCWGQRQVLTAALHVAFQRSLSLYVCKGVMLGREFRPLYQ